jgi:hypothetical protein
MEGSLFFHPRRHCRHQGIKDMPCLTYFLGNWNEPRPKPVLFEEKETKAL